jgi:hypothetical protein
MMPTRLSHAADGAAIIVKIMILPPGVHEVRVPNGYIFSHIFPFPSFSPVALIFSYPSTKLSTPMSSLETGNSEKNNDGNCLDLDFVLTKVATKDDLEDDTKGCCMKADDCCAKADDCCSQTNIPKTEMSKIPREEDINNVVEGGYCNCASWCATCGGYCSWCNC